MLTVLIQPDVFQRQPVVWLTPIESSHLPNATMFAMQTGLESGHPASRAIASNGVKHVDFLE